MSLHPEILALIEAGPQQVAIGKDGIGVESYAMFARRIAQRAVELEQRSNSEAAMKAHGASFDDLHICGNCDGTGYTV